MASALEHALLLIVALSANFLSALVGGGAGLLQLPALIFLGLPFSVALVTHKIASVALGMGATVKHAKQGHLRWPFVVMMLGAGLPGVVTGANLILLVPEKAARTSLGLLTIALSLYSFLSKQLGQQHNTYHRNTPGLIVGALVLFILGILNGSLTSGTGLFVTLWLIVWFGFDFKHASAYTMIIVGVFWNGSGALTLALQSPVQWQWLPMLLAGSLIGGYFGANAAIKYGNQFIKRVFEILTLAAGAALIIK